jgi:hypothetical protein
LRHVQHSCRSSHLSLLIAAFLFAMLTFASPAKAEFPSDFPEERLDFTVEESAGGRVTFTITTSIPTPFEAIIGISLSGQQPRDVYIGHAERVFIDRERTEITLNLLNARINFPPARTGHRLHSTTLGAGATATCWPPRPPTL